MGPGPAHGGELRAKAALADEVPQAATPRSQVCAAAGTSLSRNRHAKKSRSTIRHLLMNVNFCQLASLLANRISTLLSIDQSLVYKSSIVCDLGIERN